MRRSKGYTDKLEKINNDYSSLAVIIGFKEATQWASLVRKTSIGRLY